ncbi:MAG: DUF1036 domain-containing protein [Hyphomonadaceae bacterium]|nr:DUF1036 domain-containing protein [Hyphomonadaceae bacterium]
MFIKIILGFFAIALTTALPVTAAAQANSDGWEVCNETSYIIEASTGRYEGQGVVVEGWTRLRPGACEKVVEGNLQPGIHYLFGRSSTAHRGGRKVWAGKSKLCIDPTGSFAVENIPDCSIMGLEAREFRPVLIENSKRWRTSFTETDKRNLEQASAAGVQRLLDNAGVYSGRIDGYLGRKTRAAIGDFLSSKGLDANTSDADLMDILEQTAIERARNVGLTFCNRTNKRIWSAMARRRGEGWESRGWWLLEAGGCARVIDEPLLQAGLFAYAEMESGDGEIRILTKGSDTFCVSKAKFAITGREACEEAAYRTGRFVATPAPVNRKLVFEFFERDFGDPIDAS